VVLADPVLSVSGLGFRIGGATILEDVSLEVPQGEFLTIIGPNGAGKTSLFNLLSGLLTPTAGRVRLFGKDVTNLAPYARACAGLGRTFQASTVLLGLTVLENVRLAVRARRGGSFAFWRLAAADVEAVQRAREVLELVGLAGREATAAGLLPHGDKRKLELAILLGGEFDVLLLDEPTAGVAVEDVPEMMRVIRTLHRDQSKTVLMVEHRMDVVVGLSDRIAVMHHGRLLAVGSPDEVMGDERVQSAYLGEPI
jgi:branched-chain amino acid transport system ATP-binding protein